VHENITGWLWPLHHSVFSDLKKSREILIMRKGVLPNHARQVHLDYLTQELVFLGVKHHVTASAGV
jgi:hypothetical protein